jgi:hypothetical protein
MLHGGAPLCSISSWCNGVIDRDYLSGCDVYSTSDVVLNCLRAIALLSAAFARSRLVWKCFTRVLCPFLELPYFPSPSCDFAASFFIGGFSSRPLCIFQGCPFFIRGLLNQPLFVFWGLPLFSSEVFRTSPFAFFRVAYFFIRGL